jgi:hypothetical protein
MKKTLLICGTLLALTASMAQAGGINAAWQNCFNEAGATNRTGACNTTLGSQGFIVGSYQLSADQNLKVGDEIVIDLQVGDGSAPVPPYWQFFNAGSCRQNAMSASFAFGTFPQTSCFDPWSGQAAGGVAAYFPGYGGVPGRGRVIIGAAVANPIPLPAGAELLSFQLVFSNAGTTTCTGCTSPAAIVLNEIKSVQQDGSFERCSTPLQNQCAGWQGGGTPTNCGATPAVNTSWGQVKSLYR